MLSKIRQIILKHREALLYLLFGMLTTTVNYLVYFPLYNYWNITASISNLIAWFIAVLFAFLANKKFVFKSKDWTYKFVCIEGFKFAVCRLASGMFETIALFLAVDTFGFNGNVWKILVSIIVVIINYLGSKFFVFKKNNT